MSILDLAKTKVLPILQKDNLLEKPVLFKTQENILYTNFMDSKSEGLSFSKIEKELLLKDLLNLDLKEDKNKELYVGYLNAFANFYYKENTTIFCKNKQFCFNEIGSRLLKRYGANLSMCLIDYSMDNFEILQKYGFKTDFLNFTKNNFQDHLYNCVANNFLVLCSGYCLTKSWADDIMDIASMDNANRLVIFFGPQSAFLNLINLKRLCFFKEV
ncbi:hypothetical protein DESAMIL20_816 [Desulfurella amilsii]|uniref:Heavy-metal chelation domain-containing protein n=1 Tax=Desulfurella amilsii TaxID=1562698 RepID=A0A1X4XUP7_9BACT|nr:hypothetical protein [Desulfurella amilsii]OSS41263.1 hypothetical protein DESAMIL20_816 [Desulfurella amilsii]